MLLCAGGFGHVYKGVLKGGDVVAIKRLGPARSQGEREFRSEVDIISSVRHRNVVRLRGCCSEGAKRLLVYDYLPKGSLDSHIFGEQPQRVLGAPEGLDVGPLEECFSSHIFGEQPHSGNQGRCVGGGWRSRRRMLLHQMVQRGLGDVYLEIQMRNSRPLF
jgi:serine/threonine protein kinase